MSVAKGIEYDNSGRMKYHPDYHPNHNKPYTISDLEYLCKFYEVDGRRSVAIVLGRTESTIAGKVYSLRKQGLYDYYRNLNKYWK